MIFLFNFSDRKCEASKEGNFIFTSRPMISKITFVKIRQLFSLFIALRIALRNIGYVSDLFLQFLSLIYVVNL